jgi:hypothetical protein
MKKSALVVPHASNRLVVAQDTNFLCLLYLYRRAPLLRDVGLQPALRRRISTGFRGGHGHARKMLIFCRNLRKTVAVDLIDRSAWEAWLAL